MLDEEAELARALVLHVRAEERRVGDAQPVATRDVRRQAGDLVGELHEGLGGGVALGVWLGVGLGLGLGVGVVVGVGLGLGLANPNPNQMSSRLARC